MILIDSYGWIEYFVHGKFADRYGKYIEIKEELILPTIIIYEVYKKLKSQAGEQLALEAYTEMLNARIIPLTEDIALKAADISLALGLAMADAIIYATAMSNNAKLITSDSHLKNLAGVTFIE
ncbi:MAG: type II toxin-antitoxin system VapC family toxin [Nitrososphaerales archaeon]